MLWFATIILWGLVRGRLVESAHVLRDWILDGHHFTLCLDCVAILRQALVDVKGFLKDCSGFVQFELEGEAGKVEGFATKIDLELTSMVYWLDRFELAGEGSDVHVHRVALFADCGISIRQALAAVNKGLGIVQLPFSWVSI
jgi:hypothetical protein